MYTDQGQHCTAAAGNTSAVTEGNSRKLEEQQVEGAYVTEGWEKTPKIQMDIFYGKNKVAWKEHEAITIQSGNQTLTEANHFKYLGCVASCRVDCNEK